MDCTNFKSSRPPPPPPPCLDLLLDAEAGVCRTGRGEGEHPHALALPDRGVGTPQPVLCRPTVEGDSPDRLVEVEETRDVVCLYLSDRGVTAPLPRARPDDVPEGGPGRLQSFKSFRIGIPSRHPKECLHHLPEPVAGVAVIFLSVERSDARETAEHENDRCRPDDWEEAAHPYRHSHEVPDSIISPLGSFGHKGVRRTSPISRFEKIPFPPPSPQRDRSRPLSEPTRSP